MESMKSSSNHKSNQREIAYPYSRVFLLLFVLMPLICAGVSLLLASHPVVIIDQDRLVSLATLCAEASFTFYGLVIAGYTFYSESLDGLVRDDVSLLDTVHAMKSGNSLFLKIIGIHCSLSVFGNIYICSTGVNPLINAYLHSVVINASTSLAFVVVVECASFIFRMIDPSSIDRCNELMFSLYKNGKQSQAEYSIENFLRTYNELEGFLLFCSDLSNCGRETRRIPSMYDAVRRLYELGMIDAEQVDELHSIRRYRNLLVHSSNATLDENEAMQLDQVFRDYTEVLFRELYKSYKRSKA